MRDGADDRPQIDAAGLFAVILPHTVLPSGGSEIQRHGKTQLASEGVSREIL